MEKWARLCSGFANEAREEGESQKVVANHWLCGRPMARLPILLKMPTLGVRHFHSFQSLSKRFVSISGTGTERKWRPLHSSGRFFNLLQTNINSNPLMMKRGTWSLFLMKTFHFFPLVSIDEVSSTGEWGLDLYAYEKDFK